MKAPLLALAVAVTLCGCNAFSNPVPAGTVTGLVLFNGEPAAGKRVALTGGTKATTDANGRYTFSGVPAGSRVYVSFGSVFDQPNNVTKGDPTLEDASLPSEVLYWQSAPITLDSGGKEVPAFDVSYNGLLYPDRQLSLILKKDSPVPFHWSTHLQAQHYRVKVMGANNDFSVAGDWTSDPTTVYADDVPTGTYYWQVEIDAGDRGSGLSRKRTVYF